MKTTTPKLTDDQLINLFCDAVNASGAQQASKPKLTLFVGQQMYGKRFYANTKAAKQAVSRLAPNITKALKGKADGKALSQLRRALKGKPALRKAAVDAAFQRELLYAGPPARPTPPVRVALP